MNPNHPLDMSLSVTGWAIDPEHLEDVRLELNHSEQFGDCFRVKLAFKNGTNTLLEIEMKDGAGMDVYDALTAAIRIPRMAPVIEASVEDQGPEPDFNPNDPFR
jgi:hypothetical protein